MIRIWRPVTLTLLALVTGTSLAHTAEILAKMRYDAALYVRLQNSWPPRACDIS